MGITSQEPGGLGVGQIAPYRVAQLQSGGDGVTFGNTQEIKKVTGDIVEEMGKLKEGLSDAVLLIGVAAICTLVVSQVLKLPWRAVFHMYTTRKWLTRHQDKVKAFQLKYAEPPSWLKPVETDSSAVEPQAPIPAVLPVAPGQKSSPDADSFRQASSLWTLAGLQPVLPREFYIKKVQNVAQRVLDRPSAAPGLFAHIAADAAVDDMVVVYWVDKIVQDRPDFLNQLAQAAAPTEAPPLPEPPPAPAKPDSGVAAAIAASQDNVATAVERGLDDLQIRIMFWGPIWMRLVAAIIGICVVGIFGSAAVGFRWWFMVIGAAAGYLAAFAYDVLSAIAAFRPGRR